MSLPRTKLDAAFADLAKDLIHEDGPRISTMRNYRFAILNYQPEDEFKVRERMQRLHADLVAHGWSVLTLDLQALLFERLRAQGEDFVPRVIEMEKRMSGIERSRGLGYLKSKLAPFIGGPDGLAADCSRVIREHVAKHPDAVDRTLALVGRAGALYPYFRSSALLKHLDGRTDNVPVVLLYPGERRGQTGLSFMGELEPDHDYRPRIYQ